MNAGSDLPLGFRARSRIGRNALCAVSRDRRVVLNDRSLFAFLRAAKRVAESPAGQEIESLGSRSECWCLLNLGRHHSGPPASIVVYPHSQYRLHAQPRKRVLSYLLTSSTPKCRPTPCSPAPPTLLLPYRLLLLLLLRLPLSPLILLLPERRKRIICKSARIFWTGPKRQDGLVMRVEMLLLPV